MRAPADTEIIAPEFPPRLDWVNVAFLRMDKQIGRHVVLVEFFDTARVNSLRTLGYLQEWHARYEEAGLRVIGVHSPGYSFGRDPDVARAAIEKLGIEFPVALDPDFLIWREYGNKGWPGRYIFDRRLMLRYLHYGEGDYEDAELVIQEALGELDDEFVAPAVMEPLRPEDAPGVMLAPQTEDVTLPDAVARLELVRDWTRGPDYIEAADAGAAASVDFRAGSAWAVLSGGGVEAPGLYETDGTVVADSPGLRIHGFQFTPLTPS
jgi:hypothetical protein